MRYSAYPMGDYSVNTHYTCSSGVCRGVSGSVTDTFKDLQRWINAGFWVFGKARPVTVDGLIGNNTVSNLMKLYDMFGITRPANSEYLTAAWAPEIRDAMRTRIESKATGQIPGYAFYPGGLPAAPKPTIEKPESNYYA